MRVMESDPFRGVSSRAAGDRMAFVAAPARVIGLAGMYSDAGRAMADARQPAVAWASLWCPTAMFGLILGLYALTLIVEWIIVAGPPASALAILTMLLWRMPPGWRPLSLGSLAGLAAMLSLIATAPAAADMAEPMLRLASVVGVAALLRRICRAADPFATPADLVRFTLCVAFAGPLFLATILSFPAGWSTAACWYWLLRFADEGERMLLVSSAALILCRAPWTSRLRDGAIGWATGWALAALLTMSVLAVTAAWPALEGEPAFLLAILLLAGLAVAAQRPAYRARIVALEDSGARYRVLAESSSDAVFLIDGDGICRHATAPVWALLGYRRDGLLDRTMMSHVHPADRPALRDAILSALARPGERLTIIHRARHAAGQWLWIETRMRALADPAGRSPAALACAIRDVSGQIAREQTLERRASIDSLTGLLNRDSVHQALHIAIETARTQGHGLALILFDVDHFKRINDVHGHPLGDRVLQALGDVCRIVVSPSDHAGRVGGEEFAVILQDAGIAAAIDICAQLRASIAGRVPRGEDGRPVPVTISSGIATLEPGMAYDGLFAAADRALYAAKHAGRDRAFVSVDGQMIGAI